VTLFHRRIVAAAFFSSLAIAQQVPQPTLNIDRPSELPSLIVGDLKSTLAAPSSWSSDDWGKLSLGAAAVVGISLALDRPVAKAIQRMDRSSYDPWGRRLDTLGGAGTVAIAGGAYLTGLLTDRPRLKEFGSDAALSMFVAQVCITIPIKFMAGRSRPLDDDGPYHFKPFHGGQSFPSGHATQAFTLAAVISEYGDNPWISGLAYAGAGIVGLSRLEQRAHFVSDVVAGAAIGTLTAKAVMMRHKLLRSNPNSRITLSASPIWNRESRGIAISLKF
jgi:membrane-associated phospholipid phosphatase